MPVFKTRVAADLGDFKNTENQSISRIPREHPKNSKKFHWL
jgi:hypothetical protein